MIYTLKALATNAHVAKAHGAWQEWGKQSKWYGGVCGFVLLVRTNDVPDFPIASGQE